MKRALLVGMGGIGVSVYLPELLKLGYVVDTVEPDTKFPATFTDISQVDKCYLLGIICVPNFLHEEIAKKAAMYCANILVEKPGVCDTWSWRKLATERTDTKVMMVKNNLYRTKYDDDGLMDVYMDEPENISHVEMTWINDNRVPNPGTWFTTREKSFGGVAHDLMPHLLCLAYRMFGNDLMHNFYRTFHMQRWSLDDVKDTAYGTVDPDGIYDVSDYAELHTNIKGIPLTLRTSWKEGYDQNEVTVHWKEGGSLTWLFGDLCPNDAYGNMIEKCIDEDAEYHLELDSFIHRILEEF